MKKIFETIKEEFRAVLPPTIFFFIALHVVALIHILSMRGAGLSVGYTMSIAIGALLMGKAVLIADHIPLINRFPDHPLIYNVAWKTLIYMVLSTLLHYLEEVFGFVRENGHIIGVNEKLWTEIVWPRFWAVEITLFVLVLMYCTMHELIRIIGKEKVKRIFFGPMPIPQV